MIFWIVAAGTGGHIFPGLTLADELKTLDANADFLFFGTQDRLEAKLIPAHGYRISFLTAGRWKGLGLLGRLAGIFYIFLGFFQVFKKLLKSRPSCLISVGGYVSVPTALACKIFGVPLFIVEPNIRAGLANRILSRAARVAFCAPGADALKLFRCPTRDLGNPVRRDFKVVSIRDEVRKILVLGGSQGALALCRGSLEALKILKADGFTGSLTLQCGEKNFEQSTLWQKEFEVDDSSTIAPFINKVSEALLEHDLVVARAGAMTIAELSIAGLPTVFVPFPFAADDHQRVNAKILENAGGALLVDEQQKNFSTELAKALAVCCLDKENLAQRQALSQKLLKWGRPFAGPEIAAEILKSLKFKG